MKKERKISLLFIFLLLTSIIMSLNMIYADDNSTCVEKWKCGEWDSCYHGEKERECWDVNDCDTERDKPREEKDCNSYYGDYYYQRNYEDYIDFNNYRMMNYYNNVPMTNMMNQNTYLQNQNNNPQSEQPIVINLQYPGTNYKNDKDYEVGYNNNILWIILAVFVGILVLITFITIIILALRKK